MSKKGLLSLWSNYRTAGGDENRAALMAYYNSHIARCAQRAMGRWPEGELSQGEVLARAQSVFLDIVDGEVKSRSGDPSTLAQRWEAYLMRQLHLFYESKRTEREQEEQRKEAERKQAEALAQELSGGAAPSDCDGGRGSPETPESEAVQSTSAVDVLSGSAAASDVKAPRVEHTGPVHPAGTQSIEPAHLQVAMVVAHRMANGLSRINANADEMLVRLFPNSGQRRRAISHLANIQVLREAGEEVWLGARLFVQCVWPGGEKGAVMLLMPRFFPGLEVVYGDLIDLGKDSGWVGSLRYVADVPLPPTDLLGTPQVTNPLPDAKRNVIPPASVPERGKGEMVKLTPVLTRALLVLWLAAKNGVVDAIAESARDAGVDPSIVYPYVDPLAMKGLVTRERGLGTVRFVELDPTIEIVVGRDKQQVSSLCLPAVGEVEVTVGQTWRMSDLARVLKATEQSGAVDSQQQEKGNEKGGLGAASDTINQTDAEGCSSLAGANGSNGSLVSVTSDAVLGAQVNGSSTIEVSSAEGVEHVVGVNLAVLLAPPVTNVGASIGDEVERWERHLGRLEEIRAQLETAIAQTRVGVGVLKQAEALTAGGLPMPGG